MNLTSFPYAIIIAMTVPQSPLALPTFSTASKSRLQSLYSDFERQKQSNPASFTANVEWWRRTLEDLTWSGRQKQSLNRVVLTVSQSLLDGLRLEGVGKPIGLAAVVVSIIGLLA